MISNYEHDMINKGFSTFKFIILQLKLYRNKKICYFLKYLKKKKEKN